MRLVADANVLLSALIGGRARLVLQHPDVDEVFTAAATLDEVSEYAEGLAEKKGLRLDVLALALAALPLTIIDRAQYQDQIPEATKRIGRRDPDDVEILALALHLAAPVWSNDNDFEDVGVEWHTTAELLKSLGARC